MCLPSQTSIIRVSPITIYLIFRNNCRLMTKFISHILPFCISHISFHALFFKFMNQFTLFSCSTII